MHEFAAFRAKTDPFWDFWKAAQLFTELPPGLALDLGEARPSEGCVERSFSKHGDWKTV